MNDDGLRIVPLRCKNCRQPLPAQNGDVAFYCTSCHAGFELGLAQMIPLTVRFARPRFHGSISTYRPFWIMQSTIRIKHRCARGGHLIKALKFLLLKQKDPSRSGATLQGKFFLPAFQTSIKQTCELALQMSLKPPEKEIELSAPLTGTTYGRDDAARLAEYVYVTFEARKPDTMEYLTYEMEITASYLLGIPYQKTPKGWRDLIVGYTIE